MVLEPSTRCRRTGWAASSWRYRNVRSTSWPASTAPALVKVSGFTREVLGQRVDVAEPALERAATWRSRCPHRPCTPCRPRSSRPGPPTWRSPRIRARCSGVKATPATAVAQAVGGLGVRAAPEPARSSVSVSPSWCWNQRVGRQRAVAERRHLPAGHRGDVAERGTGDAEGHGGEDQRRERQLRHPRHRGVDARFVATPTKVRSTGTKTSLTTKSWLPVPHRPDTDHVSLISASLGRQQHHAHAAAGDRRRPRRGRGARWRAGSRWRTTTARSPGSRPQRPWPRRSG